MMKVRALLLALGVLTVFVSSTAAAFEDALDRALSLAAEHRYEESRRVLAPLLAREPGSPQGLLLHGILHVYEGNGDEALTIFQKLALEHPDMFEPYNNMAVLYVERGEFEVARGILLAVLERQPQAVGYHNLGDIYVQLARRAYARGRELGFVETTGRVEQRSSDAAAVPESASDTGSGTYAHCVAAGGFRDERVVEEAQRWLRSRGAETVGVSRDLFETIEDYRVYIAPLKNRKSAAGKMRELRGRGIRDVAVILSGSLKNAVSLGIYASKSRAAKRAARIEKLGYSVLAAANTKTVDHIATIDARMSGAHDALRAAWTTRFPNHPIQRVQCG